MPLFLALVRQAGQADPELAQRALRGLRSYEEAERPAPRAPYPQVAHIGSACLRDLGGSGPPAILIPSLINPPHILDLDPETSLAAAVRDMGRRVLLLDWGPARDRSTLDLSNHVSGLLVPLLQEIDEPAALIGYCLGGTMAIAAANLVPVERVATLATPWRFSAYPATARTALAELWQSSRGGAQLLGALPMEVLQAAFWSLDPIRTVSKYAAFGALRPGDRRARRFVALEDWANEGEPVPFPAAQEMMERLFAADISGRGQWQISGRTLSDAIRAPLLNLLAGNDRIAPAATKPAGDSIAIDSGHVGMIVGSVRRRLHQSLCKFVDPACC